MEMGMEMIIKMQMSPDVGTKICLIATLINNLTIVYIASNLSTLPYPYLTLFLAYHLNCLSYCEQLNKLEEICHKSLSAYRKN